MSMTVNLGFLDPIKNQLTTLTNGAVNQLTEGYLSLLNHSARKNPEETNYISAAIFHYNVKVAIYNGLTVWTVIEVARIILGERSIIRGVAYICLLLLMRASVEKSISITDNLKNKVSDYISRVLRTFSANQQVIKSTQETSTLYVGLAKANALSSDISWKEELLKIGDCTLLKNWINPL